MIDINDSTRSGSGSRRRKQIRDWSLGRGHQAGDDQLPHAQARERRPLLRAHLRSDQGLGVLLRQVQARPLQGHHLRALRRRGDAAEGAPRAHGPHRPGRARLAHLVLQGRPEPHRLPARHRPARAREGPLLRRLDRHRGRRREAGGRPERPRGQGRGRVASGSTSTATRRSPRSRAGSPRRREYFAKGKEQDFDEDDDFWTRGLSNWAEEQGLPALERGARARRRHLRRARRRRSRPRTRRRSASSSATPRSATTASSDPARARRRRDRRGADPGGARAARQGAGEGDRLEEGRDHEAHQPDHRRRCSPAAS